MTFCFLYTLTLLVLSLLTFAANEPIPMHQTTPSAPPSPILVSTLQPFSGAISGDNSTHKSSAGQWSP